MKTILKGMSDIQRQLSADPQLTQAFIISKPHNPGDQDQSTLELSEE